MRPLRRCRPALAWLAAFALPLGLAAPVGAIERVTLRLADVHGADWRASGIEVALALTGSGAAELRIDRLELPPPIGRIEALQAHCARLLLDGPELACRGGRLQLQHDWLDPEPFEGDFAFDQASGRVTFALRGLPLAGGRIDAQGHWRPQDWAARLRGRSLELARLAPLRDRLPADYALEGRLTVRLRLSGAQDRYRGAFDGRLSRLNLAEPDGRLASEDLALTLRGSFSGDGDGVVFDAALDLPGGQLYVEPVFLDVGDHPLQAHASGSWRQGELRLERFAVDQPSVIAADGALRYRPDRGLTGLELSVTRADLAAAYAVYLQPFLIGTPLDSLRARGWLGAELSLTDAGLQRLRLELAGAGLEDDRGRFAIEELNASLRWQAEAVSDHDAPPSRLSWGGGHLRGAPLGPANLPLRVYGRNVELLAATEVPILDGALVINTLRLREAGTPAMRAAFDAELRPIDMRRLTEALGWPVFSGRLAGRLPSLAYEDGRLTVGGQLIVEAFDGRILVDHLELNDPFGQVPRLSADIYLRDLDLRLLTDTFAFGRIEGRLSGEVERLRLLNWVPAAFDARFYTPLDDRSRHRISQRAIQNISNIGGGGAGAILSRGFLRFFEDFSYERIGISCRLSEEVCLMGGLGPAADGRGYYLVKGSWLPRIDVIGFQRDVSWPTLLEQLRSVTAADAPTIK